MGYTEDSRAERKVEGADKACKADHSTSAYKGDAVGPMHLVLINAWAFNFMISYISLLIAVR